MPPPSARRAPATTTTISVHELEELRERLAHVEPSAKNERTTYLHNLAQMADRISNLEVTRTASH